MSFSLSAKKIFKNIKEGLFTKKKLPSTNLFEISNDDPVDVIFAKNLNNSGGKFFYCKDIQNLKKILEKLISHLEINKLYCSDKNLQNTFNLDNLTVKLETKIITKELLINCEFIIADQGKVMLSSEQIKIKKYLTYQKKIIKYQYLSNCQKNK